MLSLPRKQRQRHERQLRRREKTQIFLKVSCTQKKLEPGVVGGVAEARVWTSEEGIEMDGEVKMALEVEGAMTACLPVTRCTSQRQRPDPWQLAQGDGATTARSGL